MMIILGLLAIILIVFFVRRNSKTNNNVESRNTTNTRSNTRWLGGGIGWAFGGPLGAIIGFAIGKMIDDRKDDAPNTKTYMGASAPQRDFNVSLLVLSAAVMKADGVVRRTELDYVKQFFLRNFGQQRAEKYILMLKEILTQDIKVEEVSSQIGRYMDYSSKLQLLHYVFGIAAVDGTISDSEIDVIALISKYMNVSSADYNSIKAMFVQEADNSYKILEISPDATEDEIKKAYREMAKKYHPDKVSHLGEDVRKSAEQKFQEVNAAYEKIKKQRGFI